MSTGAQSDTEDLYSSDVRPQWGQQSQSSSSSPSDPVITLGDTARTEVKKPRSPRSRSTECPLGYKIADSDSLGIIPRKEPGPPPSFTSVPSGYDDTDFGSEATPQRLLPTVPTVKKEVPPSFTDVSSGYDEPEGPAIQSSASIDSILLLLRYMYWHSMSEQ